MAHGIFRGGGPETEKHRIIAVLVFVAILSLAVLNPIMSSTGVYAPVYKTLNHQIENVSLLLVSASSVSTLITVIPNDVGTPVADKLADLSSYFLIALCVLYLEKFLITTIGHYVFAYIVPIALGLEIWHLLRTQNQLYKLTRRLVVFGLILFLAVPISVSICNGIENTFQDTIQGAIDSAAEIEQSEESKENKSILDGLNDLINTITNSVSTAVNWAKNTLQQFTEAAAIIMVTSCLIPLLVLFCMIKLAKALFKSDVAFFKGKQLSPQRDAAVIRKTI